MHSCYVCSAITTANTATICISVLAYRTHHTLQEASGCGMKRTAETNEEDTPVAKQQCVESTSSSVDAN
jgi:hypothetical protein